MKKVLFCLPTWWKAETPVLARFLQIISSVFASLPLYYAALPEEFKTAIPTSYLKYIAIAGGVCAFILQFFNKKQP
ncbi:MAG: hypothetical protein WCG93_03815 [Paludibacter sp.]